MAKLRKEPDVRKTYVVKAEIDTDERTVTAIISTSAVDRDHEVVIPKGIDFENFTKNPVVLWAHNYGQPPIGKAVWIGRTTKGLKAKVKFAETPDADEIYELFKGGFLSAFSIGFISKKSHKPEPKEIAKKPEWAEVWRVIDESELLEFSAVPVPSNAGALATAVKSHKVTISDGMQKLLGLEIEEPEPEPAVYKDTDTDPEPKEPTSTIILTPHVVQVARHIPVKRHRVIRLQRHIDPNQMAEAITRRLKGQVT